MDNQEINYNLTHDVCTQCFHQGNSADYEGLRQEDRRARPEVCAGALAMGRHASLRKSFNIYRHAQLTHREQTYRLLLELRRLANDRAKMSYEP